MMANEIAADMHGAHSALALKHTEHGYSDTKAGGEATHSELHLCYHAGGLGREGLRSD